MNSRKIHKLLRSPLDRLPESAQPVAQSCTLPYRRFETCMAYRQTRRAGNSSTVCRMQFGDTAECNSALRSSVVQATVSSVSRRLQDFIRLGCLVLVLIALESLADSTAPPTSSKTQPYPVPPGLANCVEFTLEINGTPVWVEHLKPPYPADAPDWFRAPATENLAVNIAAFACTGPCQLALHLKERVKSLVVRPQHKQIAVTGKDRDFVLELPGPCKLLVEMDSLPPFLIFADPPETEKLPSEGNNVRFFGPGVHEPGMMTLKNTSKRTPLLKRRFETECG